MNGVFEFDLGLAMLSVYDADGFLGVQIDGIGEAQSGLQPYALHHTYGFASRPVDPDVDATGLPTAGCSVLFALEGGVGHSWLAGDPRITPKLPPLAKGGSIQYAATGAFALFDGVTGTWTLYVPYANGTKAHLIAVDAEQGSVIVRGGDGAGMALTDEGALLHSPGGGCYLQVTDAGVICNGNLTVNGGFQIGGPAGAVPFMLATMTPSTMGSGI